MTEEEFRNFLIEHKEELEKDAHQKLTMEKIEKMVQQAQEINRLRALEKQSRER